MQQLTISVVTFILWCHSLYLDASCLSGDKQTTCGSNQNV